jgi:hypothetical protein
MSRQVTEVKPVAQGSLDHVRKTWAEHASDPNFQVVGTLDCNHGLAFLSICLFATITEASQILSSTKLMNDFEVFRDTSSLVLTLLVACS